MGDINGLIRLLLYLLVGGLVVYAVFWILGMISLPGRVREIITIIVSILVVIWLLYTFVPGLAP